MCFRLFVCFFSDFKNFLKLFYPRFIHNNKITNETDDNPKRKKYSVQLIFIIKLTYFEKNIISFSFFPLSKRYGQPPHEIIQEIAPGLELDNEGMPKFNPLTNGGGINNEDCCIM